MGGVGSAIIDFGSTPGANLTSVAVTGQTGILSGSSVEAWMMADTTVGVYSSQYRGVNIPTGNLAYQSLPAVSGSNYLFPSSADIAYLKSKGANTIRLQFCWEAVQPTLGGSISNTYTTDLQNAVNACTALNMYCIIEPRPNDSSYNVGAFWNGTAVGSGAVTYAQFANLWTRLATLFTSPYVMFGLCNEPQNLTTAQWWGSGGAAQSAITAIRAVTATQYILVPGIGYSAASTWTNGSFYGGTANSVSYLALLANLVIAGVSTANLIVSVHSYFDSAQSGQTPVITSPTIGIDNISAAVAWGRTNGVQIHLTEFGADVNWVGYNSQTMLLNMYNYIDANADVVCGGCWWVYTSVGFNPNYIGTTSSYTAAPYEIFLDLQPASAYSFNTTTGSFTYIPPTYLTDAPDMALVTPFFTFPTSAHGHNAEEHKWMASKMGLTCGNIVPGVGFTIYAETEYRLTSTFQVRWAWY